MKLRLIAATLAVMALGDDLYHGRGLKRYA